MSGGLGSWLHAVYWCFSMTISSEFTAVVCYCSPYSSDEAAYSQSIGIDSLASSDEEWFSASDASSPPDDLRVCLSQ